MKLPYFSIPLLAIVGLLSLLAGCGGGSSSDSAQDIGLRNVGLDSANFGCDGDCPNQSLSVAEVQQVIQQAVAAAQQLGTAATIAVTDRVGNVLGVYQMAGAASTTRIDGQIGAVGGLEGVDVPSTFAAISKAGTGAYLSSQGNAFSTRTASQIVQENFNPGERNQPGGPLFGVQFSQLPCSDITVLNPQFAGGIPAGNNSLSAGLRGPRPLPLGLSADPGGLPLYKQGDPVGGIGVELDGSYTLDRDLTDFDDAPEERIALTAGTNGFEIPSERAANRMFVAGKSLRLSDLNYDDLDPLPDVLPNLDPAQFQAVALFTDGQVRAGATFGTADSGVLNLQRAGANAAILVDEAGAPRFPSRTGSALASGAQLTASEVDAMLDSVLLTALRSRAAIRRPLDTAARVSIWIVDTEGVPIGFVRTRDAPVFGIDVALQKARTAMFFSRQDAGALLDAVRVNNAVGAFNDYVGQVRNLLGPNALTGTHAFSDRAGGNMSRPFFPDGIVTNSNGPLSLPFPGTNEVAQRSWSPFNTGLQLDLVFQRVVAPLGVPINPPPSIPDTCTDSSILGPKIANGIQIFPGSVSLYRGDELVGGIGISGDGIDQDDLIAFYGVSRRGLDFAGHTDIGDAVLGFNAPIELRADNIQPTEGTRLRYVSCPEAPFRGSNEQNVCDKL